MNEGKYVFTQVTRLVPRQIFQRLVKKYNGDYRIFEGLGQALIKIVRPMYAKQRVEYIFPQDHELFALDSTTISCSIALMGWALGKYSKGAVKMHTLMDLRGSIPAFISISDGRTHDSNVLDDIEIAPRAIYTMDKAYVDFEALARFDSEGAFFITRAKSNMKYEVVSSNFNFDSSTGIVGDHIIRLTGYKSRKAFPKELRLVESIDPESGEVIQFLTNITDQLEINALEIANIYRHRWDIELFFKLIKQNLTVKHLLGCSENAVKIHLWTAIITYLLLARVKALYKSPYSITEIGTLVRVYGLVRMDLGQLVTTPQQLIPNQDVNELTLF